MDDQERCSIAVADDSEGDTAAGYVHEAIVWQRLSSVASGEGQGRDHEETGREAPRGVHHDPPIPLPNSAIKLQG